MNQIGQTRRGFLQRLAALGAAVAVGALEAVPEHPFEIVDREVKRLLGDWSKYAKPIILPAKETTIEWVRLMSQRALEMAEHELRCRLMYGDSPWPAFERDKLHEIMTRPLKDDPIKIRPLTATLA